MMAGTLVAIIATATTCSWATIHGPISNGGTISIPYNGIAPNVIFTGPYIQYTLATKGDNLVTVQYCTGTATGSVSLHADDKWEIIDKEENTCGYDRLRLTTAGQVTDADVAALATMLKGHGSTANMTSARNALYWAVNNPGPVPDVLPTADFDAQWPIAAYMPITVNGTTHDPTPITPGSLVKVEFRTMEYYNWKVTNNIRTSIDMVVEAITLDDYG